MLLRALAAAALAWCCGTSQADSASDDCGSVSGKVIHVVTGKPVAGVRIGLATIVPAESDSDSYDKAGTAVPLGLPPERFETTSSKNGSFRIEAVPPGVILVQTRDSKYAAVEFAIPLTLSPGERCKDVTVYVGEGATLWGTIYNEGYYHGVGGVTVAVVQAHHLRETTDLLRVMYTGMTRPDGTFEIPGIPGGSYDIETAPHSGFHSTSVAFHGEDPLVSFSEGLRVEWNTRVGPIEFTVEPATDQEQPVAASLALPAPASLLEATESPASEVKPNAGQMAYPVRGRVVDPLGYPVSGARVEMDIHSDTTDAMGRFDLESLVLEKRTLKISSNRYPEFTTTVKPRRRSFPEFTVRLSEGNTVEGIVTVGGVPVQVATVFAESETSDPRSTTDGEGRYRIAGLPNYVLEVQAELPDLPGMSQPRHQIATVDLSKSVDATLDFDFTAADASLDIQLLEGGQPRALNVVVCIDAPNGERIFETIASGPDGRISLPSLPAGDAYLCLKNGDVRRLAHARLESGARSEVSLDLNSGVQVYGRVVGPAVKATDSVVLFLGSLDRDIPSDVYMIFTLSRMAGGTKVNNGAFVLDNIGPGSYSLVVAERSSDQKTIHIRSVQPISVADTDIEGVEIVLDEETR